MEAQGRPQIGLKNWGKRFYIIGTIHKLLLHKDIIELHISEWPGHIWLGWPDPKLEAYAENLQADGLKQGDAVRIEFLAHQHAHVVHHLLEIKKTES